ncbi:hypothetical protein CEXT_678761 [Caerostris extrusa]|uniref:Uncharacterized protein n=1 Tax=Caerostris extrusa TaxID=172846 RepID=A0AAV4RYM7_CAEEX|nr:hypothetical protein CEXT_678761 [Caerostris extrusa]
MSLWKKVSTEFLRSRSACKKRSELRNQLFYLAPPPKKASLSAFQPIKSRRCREKQHKFHPLSSFLIFPTEGTLVHLNAVKVHFAEEHASIFLGKKVKHPIDHASRWSYREPSSPSEAEPAPPCPPCPPSPPSHQCLSVRYTSSKCI